MASRRASPVRKKKRATAKGGRKKVKVGKPKPAKKKVAGGRKKVKQPRGLRPEARAKKKKPAAPPRKKKVARKPAAPPRKKKAARKPAAAPRKRPSKSPMPGARSQRAKLAPGKWDRLLERLIGIFGLGDLAEVLDRKPSVVRGWKRRGVPENVRLSLRAVDEAVKETPPPPPLPQISPEEAAATIRAATTSAEAEKAVREAFGLPEPPPPPPPIDWSPENAARFVSDRLVDFLMARQKSEREVTGDAWKMAKESFKDAFGIREWRRWYGWIVEEYDLDEYIFDYEALRET